MTQPPENGSLYTPMTPLTADLVIPRGADFNFTLRVLDALGDPVTLTGGSTAFKAEIRQAPKRPLAAAFTVTAQTGDDAGDLLFSLTDTQTKALDPKIRYKWDCYWTDTIGTVKRLAYGDVIVEHNISNI